MIHKTAIVDKKAEIYNGVEIGPYCIIGPNVKIGSNTKLHSHVNISGNTKIGEGNEIFPFASIGTEPQDLKYKGEENSLEIGINNNLEFIGNLTPLYTPVSDFLIHPYIWYASSKPKTVLNPDEVSDIYTISCNELIHQQTLGTIPKQFKSISYDAPCFQFIQCNCWGLQQ